MNKFRTELNAFIVTELKKHPHLKFDEEAKGNQLIHFVSRELDIQSSKPTLGIFKEILIFEVKNRFNKIDMQLFVSGNMDEDARSIRLEMFKKFQAVKKDYSCLKWRNIDVFPEKQQFYIYKYPLLSNSEYNNGNLTIEMKKILTERLNDFKENHLSVIENGFKLARR